MRAMRYPSPTAPSRPIRDAGSPLLTDHIAFGAAERYDLLVHPPAAGTFMLNFQFVHWATQKVLATRSIPLVAR